MSLILKASLANRWLVLLLSLALGIWGWLAYKNTPLDAIPDLSDVQVIVKTPYAGQTPQVVENQITFPLTRTLMAVPKAKTVRGYSFFGDSYIYVLFEDGTDPYWARSRVLETLSQAKAQLPAEVQPQLGPDASGVGWVFQYALTDPSHTQDLAQLRSLQDWFLRYELQALPGVSEVASVGGMIRQYQVDINPNRLRGYGLSLQQVADAVKQASSEMGASVIEQGEAEYMVAVKGYVTKLSQLENIPLGLASDLETPVRLKDVAKVHFGTQPRRGLAEFNGEGEVVGGIVVMRSGENALKVIDAVKKRLNELKASLPKGVEIQEVYDRSGLIERSVQTLESKLWEELIVVALICLVFLMHVRSALVAVITLPLGILGAFLVLEPLGVTANIMSLGGIAIAIGTMVDAAIVMIENTHKHLEEYAKEHGEAAKGETHWHIVYKASQEVAGALFVSLLIIALSFLPIFMLQEQAGRLFSPLALTKTLVMLVAAVLAITLVPVLMGYFVRGKFTEKKHDYLNRGLVWLYRPLLKGALKWPKTLLLVALLIFVSGLYPWQKTGTEFMPAFNEGDLLYMPTTLPGLSIGNAQALLQQTDALIKELPEVKSVFGKIGRADTATDPAPLTMIETTIRLKDPSEWREGMTMSKLIAELDQKVDFPGVTNAWVPPIKTRIDMLSTGIKTPLGLKISGENLSQIEETGKALEAAISQVPGTASVYSERTEGARYIDITPIRSELARYNLSLQRLSDYISVAVGGKNLATTLEGRERYALNMRYSQTWRNSVEALEQLPIVADDGTTLQLGQVATIQIQQGPPMIKSENARLTGWTFVDLKPGVDLGTYIQQARKAISESVQLPPGISLTWSGQFESMQKAQQTLIKIIPLTLLIIFVLLYFVFKDIAEALMILVTVPFALVGALWLLWWLDFSLSIAVAVGLVALAGVATEFGVVMLLYLKQAITDAREHGRLNTRADLRAAVMAGAVQRVRPKAMTVSVIVIGLLPILLGHGTGSEVMQRIAAPMIGGMITAPLVSMVLIPILTYLLYLRRLPKQGEHA